MTRDGKILVYGATGYTGKLIARAAKAQRIDLILAGRNPQKVKELADELGMKWVAFDLSERQKLEEALTSVAVVLHAAGPFSATSRAMADACLRTTTNYLDITGEISVFEQLAARDAEAKMAGVMLLPGVGFDVVPSDCLAAHIKRRMPNAKDLKIYIGGLGSVSRGTAKTMIEGIAHGTKVRKRGQIETLDGQHEDHCDFGSGPRSTFAVSWGDISTAWHSTKIPDIEVHFEARPEIRRMVKMPSLIKSFLGLSFMQNFLKRQIDRQPEGPDERQRSIGHSVLIGIGRDGNNNTVRTRMHTPEGYSLTAQTSLAIAKRVAGGEFKPGFQTPSLVFGADFILDFESVTREDMND